MPSTSKNPRSATNDKTAWWRKAKYGMFIHWSLQALPDAAALMSEGPAGLKRLAAKFNPQKFDAAAWVRIVKEAGMKYVVLIGKHCDGFAMFKSPLNDFNIVDATPFGRDVVAELGKACRKAGIRFGVYYNQDWDNQDPGGAGFDRMTEYSNSLEDFEAYQQRKVIPQLTELLTQYGPIDIIWFDHSKNAMPAHTRRLERLVRRLQPNTLICSRLDKSLGDFYSVGDHQIPVAPLAGPWETCDTSFDNWFYDPKNNTWKSPRKIIHNLADLASKGGNYLLNVVPSPAGELPQKAITLLREVGQWLAKNGEAFYGVDSNPWPYSFDWGTVSAKGRMLFLLIEKWPRNGKLVIHGLRSRVRRAYTLADNRTVKCTENHDAQADYHILELTLPQRAPDKYVSVVAIEVAGAIDVDQALLEQPGGTIRLPSVKAETLPANYWGVMRMGQGQSLSDWYSPDNIAMWNFRALGTGEYDVHLDTKSASLFGWKGGHKVEVNFEGQKVVATLDANPIKPSLDDHFADYTNLLGSINIDRAGTHALRLRAIEINGAARSGLLVSCLRLVKRKSQNARASESSKHAAAEAKSETFAWADKNSKRRKR